MNNCNKVYEEVKRSYVVHRKLRHREHVKRYSNLKKLYTYNGTKKKKKRRHRKGEKKSYIVRKKKLSRHREG